MRHVNITVVVIIVDIDAGVRSRYCCCWCVALDALLGDRARYERRRGDHREGGRWRQWRAAGLPGSDTQDKLVKHLDDKAARSRLLVVGVVL